VLKSLSLMGILFDSSVFFFFFDGNLGLDFEKLFVG
jgi:hypothetical protein